MERKYPDFNEQEYVKDQAFQQHRDTSFESKQLYYLAARLIELSNEVGPEKAIKFIKEKLLDPMPTKKPIIIMNQDALIKMIQELPKKDVTNG